MRILIILCLWLVTGVASVGAQTGPGHPVSLVPCPVQLTPGEGQFTFTKKTTLVVENEAQAAVARDFAALFTETAGFTPEVKVGGKGEIRLCTDASLKPEAYRLQVTPKRIEMAAADAAGCFYALQTLRQLLPAALESASVDAKGTEARSANAAAADWSVPALSIQDEPRFGYRGLMIDVARFFMPKDKLLRIIDCMGMLKINTLHLHLCDDNGWRLEVKRYPLLTEVGSRRVERPGQYFPERRNARQGEPTVAKGFYTQEDIRDIVAYAARRHIEVIPEIEMPAHSNAALAAYPLLACPVVDKFIGVLPGLGGSHADVIYCAGNDSVYTFLQHIIDEVITLFPSRYIHLGGDEAWKTHWKECPLCQARMKQENLATEEDLQGYFMARMSRYVQSKGKEVMGWDELTNTRIPEGAIIFGWRGYGHAALKAAKQGHRIIMTPAKVLYLIRYQGPQWFEPFTYFGNNTLKDVYTYEPVSKDWTPEMKPLLMGIQASMWTEFCQSAAEVEHQVFPRLAAVAERAWSQPDRKDWPCFLQAMDRFNEHLTAKGVTVAQSMYNIQHVVTPVRGKLEVKLTCERPDVEIRYTTDGSAPTAQSTLYRQPLQVGEAQTVRSATFRNGQQLGQVLDLPLRWNKATAKPVLGNRGNEKLLVNGLRGSWRFSDFEWCSWERSDSVGLTIDLQRSEPVRRVTVGCITNYGMGAHKPQQLEVWLSDNNRDYRPVSAKTFTFDEIFQEGIRQEDVTLEVKDGEKARYVRVILRGAGACPPNHVRPGQEARLNVDEVIVE